MKPKKKNKEKTWLEILDELRARGLSDLWPYVSALRGPDMAGGISVWLIKAVFTAPLRGRGDSEHFCDNASTFLSLNIKSIEEAFKRVSKGPPGDYAHYFGHVQSAWRALGRRDIANLLEAIKEESWVLPKGDLAREYAEKVKDWLESEEAFQPKG